MHKESLCVLANFTMCYVLFEEFRLIRCCPIKDKGWVKKKTHLFLTSYLGIRLSVYLSYSLSYRWLLFVLLIVHMPHFPCQVTNTGTERREYEPRENHTIEMAFQGKKRQAEIKDNAGNVYIIDFNSMREYPKGDISDFVSVMRRDKIKGLFTRDVKLPLLSEILLCCFRFRLFLNKIPLFSFPSAHDLSLAKMDAAAQS